MDEILDFLDKAEASGQNVMSVIAPQIEIGSGEAVPDVTTHNVAYEARQLKSLFLKLHTS